MDKMTPTINEFANYYEFRGDYDHTPTDGERTMIEDAITGYLEDTGLAQALATLQGERDRLVAMMTAGIALIDAANAGCPVRQDRRGAKGPMCPKCGATASQQCGPVAGTEYELVQDIRAALHPEPLGEGGGL